MSAVAISARGISKKYTRGPTGGWSLHGVISALNRGVRGQRCQPDSQRRNSFWALNDVTFDVSRGERVGIVGRNGAGKSTLLKILSRVVYPTQGEATIRGRLTSLLEVGTGFNENLSGRENVYINASIHGLSRSEIDARMDDIVDFAGVRPFLDTAVKRYSTGMQMRLAFAVSAHLDPDILLLDEVLAVGDLSFQQKCLDRVDGLVSEGRTLLFVSHSMDAILRFCDRCIWLDGGHLRDDGPAERVVGAYLEELAGVNASQVWVPGFTSEATGAAEPVWDRDDGEMPSTGATISEVDAAEALARSSAAVGRTSGPPGDDRTRLLAVRVLGPDRRPTSSVAVDEPMGVEVTFEILKEGQNVQPSVYFKSPSDQFLFVVAYTDPEWLRVPPTAGCHVTTAWVPPNLLNVGITHVSVALNTPDPFETHCTAERAVSFNVYERFGDNDTARGLYSRDFPGAVRPRLTWETRRAIREGPAAISASGPIVSSVGT
jgi:lipopolysaccharide transport system ATP-binding protein